MLVVVIIIAAVVAAFAGTTVSGTQKSPSASVEFHVKNGGSSSNSYFTMNVLGVNEPIPTKNLNVITSWTKTDTDTTSTTYGQAITGGNISTGVATAFVTGDLTGSDGPFSVPTGYGNGVTDWANDTYHPNATQWGNFILNSGTSTFDSPVGYSGYSYSTSNTDPLQAILGKNWNILRAGDTISIRIVDVKSGKTIVDQNVIVEGP